MRIKQKKNFSFLTFFFFFSNKKTETEVSKIFRVHLVIFCVPSEPKHPFYGCSKDLCGAWSLLRLSATPPVSMVLPSSMWFTARKDGP
jgi:hypothetical protein